jgi:hypothetical protein
MKHARLGFFALFVCLFASLAFPITSVADEAVPRLKVYLIRASNEPAEQSDPRINNLNAQLKADFGFTNYQQIFFCDTQFIRNERATFQMPDQFGIVITYHGRRKGQREYFVETDYRGKKFVGFYACFPENAKPVLIRGPGTRDSRYIIALTP